VGRYFVERFALGDVEEGLVEVGYVLECLIEVPLENVVPWSLLYGSKVGCVLELVDQSEF